MISDTPLPYDTVFMKTALDLAGRSLAEGEFPVGCVIADGTSVIAQGRRTCTTDGAANEIDHAEMSALRALYAIKDIHDRRGLTLYATMQPCLMCFAAILLSGIGRVVYAYEDVMGGAAGCDTSGMAPLYRDNPVKVIAGVSRRDSLVLFQRFFTAPDNKYWSDSLLSRYTLNQPVSG